MEQDKIDWLETDYIDAEGITATIEALIDICEAKAQHITENWQDGILAGHWIALGQALNKLSSARVQGVTFEEMAKTISK